MPLQAQHTAPKSDYLPYVQTFADTLLAHGLDVYGDVRLPMWAALIDTRDYAVPTLDSASATQGGEGYYDDVHRRAVGGANLYHDVEALNAFRVLSAITSDVRYADAAKAYEQAFLERAQNDSTGLLGWGEHLYYNFYEDRVRVGAEPGEERTGYHEFLDRTPIWAGLWAADSARTRRAIEGLRYHFRGPRTQTYLFNRHALWADVERESPYGLIPQYQFEDIQPWIKHAALLAYSFAALYAKTGNPEWRDWALGVGSLYWRYRNAETGLTPVCIDDPRPTSAMASLTGTSMLAYWLYRAAELHPDLALLREHALTLFDAVAEHAWHIGGDHYYTGRMLLEGGAALDFKEERAAFVPFFARTAAYFAQREGDARYLEMAKRAAKTMETDKLGEAFTARDVADRLHVSLDLYDLTRTSAYLDEAKAYADRGTDGLWRGGLFARQVGDPYYEAKDGVGAFVGGLLRLHLRLNPHGEEPALADWRP